MPGTQTERRHRRKTQHQSESENRGGVVLTGVDYILILNPGDCGNIHQGHSKSAGLHHKSRPPPPEKDHTDYAPENHNLNPGHPESSLLLGSHREEVNTDKSAHKNEANPVHEHGILQPPLFQGFLHQITIVGGGCWEFLFHGLHPGQKHRFLSSILKG